MKSFDRTTQDPDRMNGQPCIRDTRLTVRRVLQIVATYPDREELHREYPSLEEDDIRQALEYAGTYLEDTVVSIKRDRVRLRQLPLEEEHTSRAEPGL